NNSSGSGGSSLRPGRPSSLHIVFSACHSRRGRMLCRNSGLKSISMISSSASLGWRGKAVGGGLQALRAEVREVRVRSFISLAFSRLVGWFGARGGGLCASVCGGYLSSRLFWALQVERFLPQAENLLFENTSTMEFTAQTLVK